MDRGSPTGRPDVALPRSRIKVFRDEHPWLGWTIFLLAGVYFLAQLAAAAVWRPRYSFANNVISDLGNTSCSVTLCSPRHSVVNGSFIVLGLVMASGSLLIFQEFTDRGPDQRRAALLGFSAMGVAGLGAVVVGIFPENTVHLVHYAGAGVAISVGTAAIFGLGWVLVLPSALTWFMRLFPPISLVALALFAVGIYLGLGKGTIERVAAYPEVVWLILFALYISRDHYEKARAGLPR